MSLTEHNLYRLLSCLLYDVGTAYLNPSVHTVNCASKEGMFISIISLAYIPRLFLDSSRSQILLFIRSSQKLIKTQVLAGLTGKTSDIY